MNLKIKSYSCNNNCLVSKHLLCYTTIYILYWGKVVNKLEKLQKLKEETDAVILAHYYVDGEIQKVADFVGDSFFLAQTAEKLENKTIVMVGVYFMAESVKILNPDKKVLLVDKCASCPMVDMITVDEIERVKSENEDIAVVCYINSSAKIKAHCDVCVTSSNALKIIESLPEKNIFFVPDKNLGSYIAKNVQDKNIILNDGCCPVHDKVSADVVKKLKKEHPNAKVLAHPECKSEVIELADFVGSTKGIILEADSDADEFIIVTEKGISSKLSELYPEKTFYYIDYFICDDMKLLTMDKLIHTLEFSENEVEVDREIAKKAIVPLERMLKLGAK